MKKFKGTLLTPNEIFSANFIDMEIKTFEGTIKKYNYTSEKYRLAGKILLLEKDGENFKMRNGLQKKCLYFKKEWFKNVKNVKQIVDWRKIPIDTKVYVWNDMNNPVSKGHFAGVNAMGFYEVFVDGTTSFTESETIQFTYIELEEEI